MSSLINRESSALLTSRVSKKQQNKLFRNCYIPLPVHVMLINPSTKDDDMNKLLICAILICGILATTAYSQKKGKGGSPKTAFKMEFVTIPDNISSSFETLKKQVLLCHPLKNTKEKSPLIISLHGLGGGSKPVESRLRSSML